MIKPLSNTPPGATEQGSFTFSQFSSHSTKYCWYHFKKINSPLLIWRLLLLAILISTCTPRLNFSVVQPSNQSEIYFCNSRINPGPDNPHRKGKACWEGNQRGKPGNKTQGKGEKANPKKKKKEQSNWSWGGAKVSLTSKQAAGGAGFYSNTTRLWQQGPSGINQLLVGFSMSTDVRLKVTCLSLSFWALLPHFI